MSSQTFLLNAPARAATPDQKWKRLGDSLAAVYFTYDLSQFLHLRGFLEMELGAVGRELNFITVSPTFLRGLHGYGDC